MSRYIKNKYRSVRKEFREDMYDAIKENPALGMLVIKTYVASKHRAHIHKIWGMFFDYPAFAKDYKENLMGQHLTGRDEIFHSLYFAAPKIRDKYLWRIPEAFAMGDALAAAYKAMRRENTP
ncbi:hypothetical protein ABEW32_03530 [Paenibacillus jamilae]|uniref:hypothetical protein n=1 Tax=Paenibacillus jamilae TaxID=114136 RepID=UPI003D27ABB8